MEQATKEKEASWIGFPYFSKQELACRCGCGFLPEEEFILKVKKLREAAGFIFIVTSGARCPTHNRRVAASGLVGPHTKGRAIDIAISLEKAYKLVGLAIELGFTGIGVNQKGPLKSRIVHLDDLEEDRPRIWSY